MGKYFGTDGVRGEANVELTPELAFKLGRFGGYVLSQHETGRPKVFVARDTRISGEMLESALVAGLLSVGIEVYKLGVLATPGVSYLVRTENASAGVMISASHNPALDNGIKFFGGDGFKLDDAREAEIEALLDAAEDTLPRPSAEGRGSVSSAASRRASISASRASSNLKPSPPKNLIPLSRAGLWLAEIITPALAFSVRTKYETPGVASTPSL